jgi:hypothetical protein
MNACTALQVFLNCCVVFWDFLGNFANVRWNFRNVGIQYIYIYTHIHIIICNQEINGVLLMIDTIWMDAVVKLFKVYCLVYPAVS